MGAGSAAAGVTIPVIMISQDDGAILSNALDNSTPIEVTFSNWGNGFANDIGIVSGGATAWHNSVTPLTQMTPAVMSHAPYKGINGAVIANYGTVDQTGVKLVSTITWYPDGGSPTVVYKDSVTGLTLAASDSIITPFANEYDLPAPTSTGRYEVEHVVSMDNPDDFIDDNTYVTTFYVSDNILSKGRFDFTENEGISLIGYNYANSMDFIYGPLYYLPVKDHQIRGAQFNLLSSATPDFSQNPPVNIVIFKWTDAGAKDGIIQQSEVEIKGVGSYEFVMGDSSGHAHWVPIVDALDNTKIVVTEENSHYWTVLTVPTGLFIGTDGLYNQFPRSWGRHNNSGYKEAYSPIFPGSLSVFDQGSTNEALMFPFEATQNIDSVRFAQQKGGLIASIPLNIAPWTVSVDEVSTGLDKIEATVYPNPANDVLNLNLNLAKKADRIYFSIIDATGRPMGHENAQGVKEGSFTISTSHLASGNYYLIINVDGVPTVRPFTIMK